MLGLVLGAIRARAGQALTVLVLTALAAAVAVAGPWYAVAAASRAAASDVEHAPAAQRVVSVRQPTTTSGEPQRALDAFATEVRRLLPVPDLSPVLGMSIAENVLTGSRVVPLALGARDGLCDHLALTGQCPARAGEILISQEASQVLGAGLGSTLGLGSHELSDPIPMRIVGLYTFTDPAGAYWSNNLFQAGTGLDPAFTTVATFADPQFIEPTLTYDVEVPEALIRGDGGYDLAGALQSAADVFDDADLRLVDPTGRLLETVAADRALVRDGVLVALGQVLVLSWFAMGLAGRYTGRDRRGDAALMKLRGSTRRRMLALAFGQHLVPVLAGAVAGTPLGMLTGWWLAGPVRSGDDRVLTTVYCAVAVAAVLVVGLLVLVAVEIAVLRLPVAALLRRVSPGRRTWRADLLDLVLLAVAVAAIYQARAGDPGRGLALVAPALVALAVALLLARLLGRVADRAGGAALRTGRLRLGLTATRISRQPGTDRVFALVTVAVAILATAGGTWWAGRTARIERSEVELGADRVLTVEAANRTALMNAVRAADPDGRSAMAVVARLDVVPPLLAVDSARLATVAHWRPEYGDPAPLHDAVSAPLPGPVRVDGDRLALRARNDGPDPVLVTVLLQNEGTGHNTTAVLGPLPRGEHALTAAVTGCSGDTAGCRVVGWDLGAVPTSPRAATAPPLGARVTVRALDQLGPDRPVLDAAALGDVRRWRTDFVGAAVQVQARSGALELRMDRPGAGSSTVGTRVYAVDATLPLPVVLAGEAPTAWQFGDPLLFAAGPSAIPVRAVGMAPVLPVLGRSGLLTDLDTARRMAADSDPGGVLQVWLTKDAPASVVPALEQAGLSVVRDETVAQHADRLGEQGTAQGDAFALLAALVGVLLAAAAVAVATAADRGPHLDQLRALRVQGLSARTARTIGYAAGTALVLTAVLAGLVAAEVADPVAGRVTTAFTDAWADIPPPVPLSPVAAAAAGLVAVLLLTLAARLPLRRLGRELRGDRR
ncbi:FtsX-like permease family protein [Actinoplanes sp. NPDC051494]|uniref:FtsX-like permease family protein n=1 Tax=Actinoplanes sp. NPDC051494 TaxID=3363907 RepID=UPI0037ABFFC9